MLQRPRTDTRRRILCPGLATRAATREESWEEENFPAEDGYEYNDWDDFSCTWQRCSVEQVDDWEEEGD